MNSCKLFCLCLSVALITEGSNGAKLDNSTDSPAPVTTEPATTAPVTPASLMDSFDSNSLMDSGSCSLTLSNYTWSYNSSRGDQSVEGVTKENCAKKCLSQSWCRGYTWSKEDSSGSICHMFKQLTKQIACKDCSQCVSGKATPITGLCSENWIHKNKTDSELGCLELCSKTNGCQYYTYYTGNSLLGILEKNNCYLYSQCTQTSTCEPFQTGKLECIEKTVLNLSENHPECNNYEVLDSPTRHRSNNVYSSGNYYADKITPCWDVTGGAKVGDWKGGNKWYRVTGRAGTKLTETSPGMKHCGANDAGWLSGGHPTTIGDTVQRTVFYEYGGNPKYQSNSIKITHCGSYFVYYLVENSCDNRYCTE